jgi:NTP pyrophosphatase (non-canonical NTP hydrolase)
MSDDPSNRAEAIKSTPTHNHPIKPGACTPACPSYGQLGWVPAEQIPERAPRRPAWPLLSDITMDAIQAEATRAHVKHKQFSMLYGTNDRRFRILMEEAAEVARELNDAEIYDRPVAKDKLVKELIQVSAMAATWIEALEGDQERRLHPFDDPYARQYVRDAALREAADQHAQDVDGPAVEVNVSPGPTCAT